MSIPAVGHNSYMLIAKETTYGTAPGAATNKYDFASFDWDSSQEVMVCPNINSAGASSRAMEPGLQAVTGKFTIQVGFEGFEEMWRFLWPTYSTAVVETTARDHTFKEGVNQNSYTFDVSFGNIPSTKVTRFTGVFCTGWRFTLDRGLLVLEVGFAAEDVLENTTPMTGSLNVLNLLGVPFHTVLRTTGNLKDGSGIAETSIFVRSLAMTVEFPLDTQRTYLGSRYADSPIRNGLVTAKVETELQWDALNYVMMGKMLVTTLAAGGLKFLFQHATTIGASSKRELEFTAAAPVPAGYSQQIPGPGVITQRCAFQLQYDPTAASCLVVRNRSLTVALP